MYTHTHTHIHTHTHTHTCSRTEEILAKIQEVGFEIAMQKELTLTKEQAAQFYSEHEGKEYFESLCNTMARSVCT